MAYIDFIESIRLDGEEWKFFETGEYAISSLGRVASFKKKNPKLLTIVAQESRGRKYSHVCINSKKVRVHRLVAEAFIPNPNGYKEVDHINNNPLDNRVCNLRWVTHSENMRNPYTIESKRQYMLTHPFEKNGTYPRNVHIDRFYNYHEEKMKAIVQIKDGNEVARYKSLGEAERNGYKKTSISATINGRLKTYRGYEWMLISDYEATSKKEG